MRMTEDPSPGVLSVESIEENNLVHSHFWNLSVLGVLDLSNLDLSTWSWSKISYLWQMFRFETDFHICFTLCLGQEKKDGHLNLILEASPKLTSYLLSESGNISYNTHLIPSPGRSRPEGKSVSSNTLLPSFFQCLLLSVCWPTFLMLMWLDSLNPYNDQIGQVQLSLSLFLQQRKVRHSEIMYLTNKWWTSASSPVWLRALPINYTPRLLQEPVSWGARKKGEEGWAGCATSIMSVINIRGGVDYCQQWLLAKKDLVTSQPRSRLPHV